MAKQNGYNGYKNYSQWNQSLWINNDERLYRLALEFIKDSDNKEQASRFMLEYLQCDGTDMTPDGVKWSKAGIRAAMQGL
jgi:hypothetical protein